MKRMPPEQRRAELIAAAVRVIARDGVTAASTRAIVAEADMPLGAFHFIFTSRDELLQAVIHSVTDGERIAARISISGGPGGLDIESTLRAGLNSYLDLLESDPNRELALLELAIYAFRLDPEGLMRDQYTTYYAAVTELLRYAAELMSVTWIVPVEELARHLVASVDGLTTTWLADRDTAAARRTAQFIAKALASYAITSPTQPEPSPVSVEPAL